MSKNKASKISVDDMKRIAEFNRVVKNYLKMKRLLND